MSDADVVASTVIGLIKIRSHCLFTWHAPVEEPSLRVVDLRPEHCAECIAELRNLMGPAVNLVPVERPQQR